MLAWLLILYVIWSWNEASGLHDKENNTITSNDEYYFKHYINVHYDVLLQKKRQTVYTDDYGNTVWDGFDREAKHFIKNVIYRNSSHVVTKEELSLFYDIFQSHSKYNQTSYTTPNTKDSKTNITSGIDYENYIFTMLKDAGYKVQKTAVTGDQGVDLIVLYRNKRFAIQCKYYSSPVGNKAVQEVIAGKGYYNCDYAIVCSNNVFTQSAHQLAHTQNVYLVSENTILDCLNKLWKNI